ncbi:MAG: hypothetical protein V1873_04785 [Verrucomicrobiota bacterium]
MPRLPFLFRRLVPALALALWMSSCASVPYQHDRPADHVSTFKLRPGEPQVERGMPLGLLDGLGWVIGIPSKIILLDRRMDNHYISPETEEALVRYLQANSLTEVKVRLNEYAPIGEWSRLFRNKDVCWAWRYTLGTLSLLGYTLLPGRLLGGDNYNPYTDTISIYSDHPAVARHEGGHSKDFARRTYKGTYGALYMLPFFALYPEALATGDAIGYLRTDDTAETEKQAYKVLYPAYGTYIGGNFGQFFPAYSTVIYLGVVIPGHVLGRIKAAGVDERRAAEPPVHEQTTPDAASKEVSP